MDRPGEYTIPYIRIMGVFPRAAAEARPASRRDFC
jgi:hypothetical protein